MGVLTSLSFSRRFMKCNATIIVTFFNPHQLTKIVPQKFYEILTCQIELFRLADWTKKVFPVIPRNIQYRARLKVPPFSFFSILWFFFEKIPQRVPLQFFRCFATKNIKKFERIALLARRRPASGLPARQLASTFGFSGTVKEYLTLWSPFAIFEPKIWRRLMPFPGCFAKPLISKSLFRWKAFFLQTINCLTTSMFQN